jgi:hypothetical protein
LPWGSSVAVVGESFYEDAFRQVCGPKREEGYDMEVVAELWPEPDNPYDSGAVAVRVRGFKVGHLSREDARLYRALIDEALSVHGVASCHGLIRGGWDRGSDAGRFGVWLRFSDRSWSFPPPADDEYRLEPGGSVSVSNEERYQDVLIEATKGRDVTARSYPVLADLVLAASNPWAKGASGPILAVRLEGRTVGFLTAAMSARYIPVVQPALADGKRVTTEASLYAGTKKGEDIIEIRLHAREPLLPGQTPTVTPKLVWNVRTGTAHAMGEQDTDGSWRTPCGVTVRRADARLLGSTKPWIGYVDIATGHVVSEGYYRCDRC